MATEREMKAMQEDRLYGILLLEKCRGDADLLDYTFGMLGEKAQSGMTADEIDAVRERVNRTYSRRAK